MSHYETECWIDNPEVPQSLKMRKLLILKKLEWRDKIFIGCKPAYIAADAMHRYIFFGIQVYFY